MDIRRSFLFLSTSHDQTVSDLNCLRRVKALQCITLYDTQAPNQMRLLATIIVNMCRHSSGQNLKKNKHFQHVRAWGDCPLCPSKYAPLQLIVKNSYIKSTRTWNSEKLWYNHYKKEPLKKRYGWWECEEIFEWRNALCSSDDTDTLHTPETYPT